MHTQLVRNAMTHGKATVSWGQRPFGADRLIANAPMDALDDLIELLGRVKTMYLKEERS